MSRNANNTFDASVQAIVEQAQHVAATLENLDARCSKIEARYQYLEAVLRSQQTETNELRQSSAARSDSIEQTIQALCRAIIRLASNNAGHSHEDFVAAIEDLGNKFIGAHQSEYVRQRETQYASPPHVEGSQKQSITAQRFTEASLHHQTAFQHSTLPDTDESSRTIEIPSPPAHSTSAPQMSRSAGPSKSKRQVKGNTDAPLPGISNHDTELVDQVPTSTPPPASAITKTPPKLLLDLIRDKWIMEGKPGLLRDFAKEQENQTSVQGTASTTRHSVRGRQTGGAIRSIRTASLDEQGEQPSTSDRSQSSNKGIKFDTVASPSVGKKRKNTGPSLSNRRVRQQTSTMSQRPVLGSAEVLVKSTEGSKNSPVKRHKQRAGT